MGWATIEGGMKVTLLHLGLLSLSVALAAPVYAQDADESALDALDNVPKPPPVQQEPPGAVELRDAVRRIAQRPTDSFALTDAGYAAIKLGDYDAAFNFFTKASGLQPSDARIKAGLGIAEVRRENPFEALGLFDQAIKLGANERSFALDRGLAYDLLGNFERAQRDYTLAATYAPVDELTIRQAISLSLAGRKDEADKMLVPLLQKNTPEAWRARAMMLAARGDAKEAGKITRGFLAEPDARRMDGYLRNMDRLTPAQQAAAMHFGHFPVGAEIGEDSKQVRTMAAATGVKPIPASGDARLIPSGEPLGTKAAVAAKGEKPKKPVKADKKPNARSAGIATASAQQAIDAAARAKVTPVTAASLPPPESARPPVRISLPALARPQPAAIEQQPIRPNPAPTTQQPKQVEPIATRVETAPATVPVLTPTQPAVVKRDDVKLADNGLIGPPAPVVSSSPSPTPIVTAPAAEPAVVSQQVASSPIDGSARVSQSAPQTEPIGPGFETLPTAQSGIAVATPAPVPTPAQVSTPVSEPAPSMPAPTMAIPQPPPEPVVAQAPVTQPEPQPVTQPAPVTEKAFDLGALVDSIEVPEEEKKPSVAPVDLNTIRVATSKADAEAISKNTRQQNAGPRIWVQIATGADAAVLGGDYRRAARKNSALFANQSGWTAVWNKTKRLLVGPFADMKTAKKWEADFRKLGGQGFVWQSDKTADITKLK
jgi:Flp pilus assembly protein TadD